MEPIQKNAGAPSLFVIAPRKPYLRPAILLELDLETRAGTGTPVVPDFCPGCPPAGGSFPHSGQIPPNH